MIIGKGLIAKAFKEFEQDSKYLIFASGVSNSSINIEFEFNKEIELIRNTIHQYSNYIFIYFSTCSIYDDAEKGKHYVLHKLKAENFIIQNAKKYFIFRVSNVVGNSYNPNTIFNFLVSKIRQNEEITLWKYAYRNLIDVDDLCKIIKHFISINIETNKVINVANVKSYNIIELATSIAEYVDKKLFYKIIEKGSNANINLNDVYEVYIELNLVKKFNDNYLRYLLNKYVIK